jgi:hypothetical protein
VREGSLYRLKEHDSIALYPSTNSFSRFSETQSNGKYVGGSVIDLVMELTGASLQDSIELLKNETNLPTYSEIKRSFPSTSNTSKENEEVTPFVLPEKTNGKYNRTFAYLTKTRGIDNQIVSEMMKNNYIYEDERHNAVFCGKDKSDNIVYATKKSTITESKYRGDVAGSNQEIGVFVNHNANTLVVNEAFIDSMSYMTLMSFKGKDYHNQNYLALGGVSGKPVIHHLKENEQINKVILALDNDNAGKKTIDRIIPMIDELAKENNRKIDIEICIPREKDFNEDLKKVRKTQEKKLKPLKEIMNELER